jgi:molybdopterin-guanine dinucleotide biosynthesis protein A
MHGESTLLSTSAVILAGGLSSRFGRDKGMLELAGKPLLKHVLDRINNVVDEKIVVVSSERQLCGYANVADESTDIITDSAGVHGPLGGAKTGFDRARGEYLLLLPCDTPFVSRDILSLILELCTNRNACIPRWPNGYVEPLQAVYRRKQALTACNLALSAGEHDMKAMLNNLQCVRYVSTLVLEQLDPGLKTFFNINSPLDLRKAEQLLSRSGSCKFARSR